LGLTRHLEASCNTADIGFAKPDPRAFQHVCAELGVAAPDVFFTDDSERKLAGAIELGMCVHHFTDVDGLRAALTGLGVLGS